MRLLSHPLFHRLGAHPRLVAGVGIAIVGIGAFVVYPRSHTTIVSNLPVVTAVAAINANVSDASSFTGTLQPVHEVDMAAKTSGQLSGLYTDVGQRVGQGQTIAELDATTERATARSITQNINAAQQNVSALNAYYQQQIGSQTTQTEHATDTADTGSTQTAAVSALTNAVMLAQQVSDTLGTLLSVRIVNGNLMTNSAVSFDTNLGAKNSQAKITARNTLESYQPLNVDLQSSFTDTILNKNPTQAQVTIELAKAVTTLTSAKLALSQAYTVLTDSVTSGDLSDANLAAYETNITALGGQTQAVLQNMHDVSTNVASLQGDRDAKIASAQSQVVALQGQAAVTDTVLADGMIHSSISGIVTTKYVEQGTVVAPGTPLVHIVDDSTLKLIVGVPDSQASSFHVGDTAIVLVDDAGGHTYQALITRINPTVDPISRKVTIEVSIPNSIHVLKVGSYAHAIFAMPHGASIAVPRTALRAEYGASYVFVIDGSAVRRRMVAIGAESTDLVEILSGLKIGEMVVTAGGDYLRDGDPVTVTQS